MTSKPSSSSRPGTTRAGARPAPWRLALAVPLLAALPGCIVIPIGDLLKGPPMTEQTVREGGEGSRSKIALIDVSGTLTASEDTGLVRRAPNAVSEIKAQLDEAADDPRVRAIVLRISSPGGEVTACDMLHHEVLALRERHEIPVVACIQDVGASGGYYIACAADRIVAHPTAVVGSIGVILQSFDVSGLLGKVGVRVDPVKSSTKKDLASIFRPRSEEETRILEEVVEDLYSRFVDVVDQSRADLDRNTVLELADGRVVSGQRAASLGLVDETGYLDDAIDRAAEAAGVDSPSVVRYTRKAQGGANIYTISGEPTPAALDLRWSPGALPRAGFFYLWKP